MQSLPYNYRAVVVGATGAIGSALVRQLHLDPRCGQLISLSRSSKPSIDFQDAATIVQAAEYLRNQGPLHLIIVATGILHEPGRWPEKRLSEINYNQMMNSFTINTFGPAMVCAHFSPLLVRHERSLFAALSAKVGSIQDNHLGGWYSYRASKAALNMIVKTASIELARTHPHTVVAALHPGTVDSPLSAPFSSAHIKRTATQAATELLQIIDGLPAEKTGSFWAYDGQQLPW